jgi:hypothetical protein
MTYKMMKMLLMKQRDLISVAVMSVPGNWLWKLERDLQRNNGMKFLVAL